MKYPHVAIFVVVLWTASANIKQSYFLPTKYTDYWRQKRFRVKQVPGDGACLFNALAVSVRYLHNGFHSDYDSNTAKLAAALRSHAVHRLSERGTLLFLGGTEYISTDDLLALASIELNKTVEEYLHDMRLSETWGGGPEIVAISNILGRPIHLYTVCHSRMWPFRYYIKKSICFGESANGTTCQPVCVLYTDGRFPHVTPWRDTLTSDHFLALFDESMCNCNNKPNRRKRGLGRSLEWVRTRTNSYTATAASAPNHFDSEKSSNDDDMIRTDEKLIHRWRSLWAGLPRILPSKAAGPFGTSKSVVDESCAKGSPEIVDHIIEALVTITTEK